MSMNEVKVLISIVCFLFALKSFFADYLFIFGMIHCMINPITSANGVKKHDCFSVSNMNFIFYIPSVI